MSLNEHQRRVTARSCARISTSPTSIPLRSQQNSACRRLQSRTRSTSDRRPIRHWVWRLRDHLESAARAAGAEPHEYTYLPERMRSAAQVWFGVGDHRFSD